MAKRGRPKIKFTEEQFKQLEKIASYYCTQVQMCDFFGLSEETLNRLIYERYGMSFADFKRRQSAKGKINLVKLLHKHAQSSPVMAIFLAKSLLGYDDKNGQKFSEENGKPIININLGD